MKERNQFLLLTLMDAGATPSGDGLTLSQFRDVLARHKVFADTKTISNWLRQPVSSGLITRSGTAGGPFHDPDSEGYKFKVSSRGGAWLAATLNLVEGESETGESEAEVEADADGSVLDEVTKEASKPEPKAEKANDSLPKKKDGGVISGAVLLLLGTLAGLAYYSPPVRQFLADWWSRNFPKKSGPEEVPPETPSGLTV